MLPAATRIRLVLLGWLALASACADELTPPPNVPPVVLPAPVECELTAGDWKNGIGRSECDPYGSRCYRCFGEFSVPLQGCVSYPGGSAEGLCVLDCGLCPLATD